MTINRESHSAKIISDTKNMDVDTSSRTLIKALKKEIIKHYYTPLMHLQMSSCSKAHANIFSLDELEKKYANVEIPRKEIIACLISTGPSFEAMVFRCLEKFPETVEYKKNETNLLSIGKLGRAQG